MTFWFKNCLSLFISLSVTALLAACGGGGGSAPRPPSQGQTPSTPPTTQACTVDTRKQFVLDVVEDWYLWYDEVASVNADDYDSAEALLDALTEPLSVDGRDPGFSYVTTRAADEAGFTSGAFVGFGFRYDVLPGNRFYFADVYEGGPAGEAGLDRGDEVLAVDVGDGFETIDQLAARNVTLSELFGANEAGIERGFRVQRGDEVRDVVLAKRELDTPPLAGGPRLLERPGLSPVGYFKLRAFILSAEPELIAAAQTFRAQGVTDFVIDLRYNGGGLVDVADQLLDLLGGIVADGEESFRIAHNDKKQSEDVSAVFVANDNSLEPLRIAFITTQATASASELLINSLAPHIDVVLVGEDTLGKAVGQYAFDEVGCETRLRLVAFETVNGEGQGGYYTGLVDTGRFTLCPADDDVTRPFGDPSEASLSVALNWLNNGVCGAATAAARDTQRQLPTTRWELSRQADQPFGLSPWVR